MTSTTDWRLRSVWRVRPWRRRAWRWATLAAGVVVLVVAARAVYAYRVVNSDALSIHHLNVLRAEEDQTGVTEIDNALGSEYRVDYQRGGSFLAEFELRNTGSRGVTVERILPGRYYYFRIERVLLSLDRRLGMGGPYVPLRPFELPAGESRHLRVAFGFPDCDFAGTPTRHVVRELPVAYRIAGRERSPYIGFVEGAISVMANGTCEKAFPSP